jgi:hypothetical protein
MRALRLVAAGIGVVVLALPGQALAGTVTRTEAAITYDADPATGVGERVDIGIENGLAFVYSDRGVTGSFPCTEDPPNRVDCPLTPAFIVNFLGFNDSLGAEEVTGPATLEAHGRGGDDNLSGTPNADRLFGDEGGDSLYGGAGNDLLDGAAGDDYLYDGDGDDSVSGGPNNDTITPGGGRDTFSGGDGTDSVEYTQSTQPVTITADGQPDDGAAGEGDNVATDIESLYGGIANDRIVAGPNANTLRGYAGNDSITGGPGEQRIEGDEGDDTIDSRDGVYDSIDCGPGNDVVFADADDFTSGCEVAPDRDGDGTLNEQDCEPDNAAVHPGAGEIFGNTTDEDCAGGPGYFRVLSGISVNFSGKRYPPRIRILSLRITALQAGDRIEVRCRGRGCPFRLKRRTASRPNANLVSLFKRRYLRRGAVVEVRVLRASFIGKVLRMTVTARPNVKQTPLCLGVGATTPGRCPPVG